MLLTSSPSGSKSFIVIDLCCVFFSILIDETNHILAFTQGAKKIFTWIVMPQCSNEQSF